MSERIHAKRAKPPGASQVVDGHSGPAAPPENLSPFASGALVAEGSEQVSDASEAGFESADRLGGAGRSTYGHSLARIRIFPDDDVPATSPTYESVARIEQAIGARAIQRFPDSSRPSPSPQVDPPTLVAQPSLSGYQPGSGGALDSPVPRLEFDFSRLHMFSDSARHAPTGASATPQSTNVPSEPDSPGMSVDMQPITGQIAQVARRMSGVNLHRASEGDGSPPPTKPATTPGNGPETAEPSDTSQNGSTTIQDPPTRVTTEIHGATLADVANALPAEAGAVDFDFSISTSGEPITQAILGVQQTLTMPKWMERDQQCPPVQKSWDSFSRALQGHEDGHLALDRQLFANAHQRFVGKPSAQTTALSDTLRQGVQGKQDAYDQQTDHGRKGTPPTILDTSVTCGANSQSSLGPTNESAPAEENPDGGASPDPAMMVSRRLQTKLTVSQPGDDDEREADAIAAQVVKMEAHEHRQPANGSNEWQQTQRDSLFGTPRDLGQGERAIHRQRSEAGAVRGGGELHAGASEAVRDALASSGQSLDPETRAFMEPRFGHDFSKVLIHADDRAAESARAIQARAYTVGADIVLGPGEQATGTRADRQLIAHELVHVVQQGVGAQPLTGSRAPSDPIPDAQPEGPSIQRQEAPSGTALSPADQLKADFEHEVATSGWVKAAELLDRFNDTDLAAKAAWLSPQDRTAVRENTPEPLGRVRGALLVADFDAAMLVSDWSNAAISLNGLDNAGIEAHITPLTRAQRTELYVGAVNAMTGVSRNRIIEPIARLDLDAALNAALRPAADWAKAVEYLNGFSDADLRARAGKLQTSERTAMLPIVPEWSSRVRGALLDAAFTDALASSDFDAAARDLNGFDDPGIKEHVAQVQEEQLEPLLQASDRVNGGNAMRSDRHIFGRMLYFAMTANRWQAMVRTTEGYLDHGGSINHWLDDLNPGQLQALLTAAQEGGFAKTAQLISPRLSQKLSDQQSTTLTYTIDPNAPPGQINLTQSRERQDPKYIDNVAFQVMVGIYLPGYFVYCAGQDLPIVVPWEYVNYSTTATPSIDEVVYPSREAALAQIAATPSAPRGAYAYYQAAGGFHAPTVFSWGTTPHIVGMLQDALSRLRQEVQDDLVVQGMLLAGAVAVDFATTGLARSGAEAKAPTGDPAGPGKPNNGNAGAMRRYTYEVGPMDAAKPGLRSPSKEVGQEALDNSLGIGPEAGRTRRVGINHDTREFVDFQETENESGIFRGTVRPWEELPPAAQNELIGTGAVTRGGKIVGDLSGVERVARFNNFRRTVAPEDLQGAPPAEGSKTPGHARSKHGKEGMTDDVQAEVLNRPERTFNGVNENGREVDIYCKRTPIEKDGQTEMTDVAVITEAGNKQSVITAHERSPDTWSNNPSYVEVRSSGSNEIIYHSPEDFQTDFWPDWKARSLGASRSTH